MQSLYKRPNLSGVNLQHHETGNPTSNISLSNRPVSCQIKSTSYTMNLPSTQLNRLIEIYTWRNKTSLPIHKIGHFEICPQGDLKKQDETFTFDMTFHNSTKNGQ